MASFLEDSVQRITVETTWLPDIVLDRPFAPAQPGAASFAVRALRPKVTLHTSLGPVVSRPFGEPQKNWPMLKTSLTVVAGFTAFGLLLRFAMRPRRPSARLAGLGLPPEAHQGMSTLMRHAHLPRLAREAMSSARRGKCRDAMRFNSDLQRTVGKIVAHDKSSGRETPRDVLHYANITGEKVNDFCCSDHARF
jgi:hypothetical protein